MRLQPALDGGVKDLFLLVGGGLEEGDIAGLGSSGGRVGVRSLDMSARLARGLATIDETTLDGPDLTLTGHGTLDLRTRMLDLRAMASHPGDEAARAAPVVVVGPLDTISLQPGSLQPGSPRPGETR